MFPLAADQVMNSLKKMKTESDCKTRSRESDPSRTLHLNIKSRDAGYACFSRDGFFERRQRKKRASPTTTTRATMRGLGRGIITATNHQSRHTDKYMDDGRIH